MRNPDTAHWRDSARTAKFFVFDAYSAMPIPLFLLHIRWWTFALTLSICIFFAILNKFGFSLPVFWRWTKAFLGGNNRSTRPWFRKYKY